MKTKPNDVSAAPAALRQVWEWKDALWREVERLPTRDAVHQVLVRARKTAEELGFRAERVEEVSSVSVVAEGRTRYGKEEEEGKTAN
jgi:hypothetical protein